MNKEPNGYELHAIEILSALDTQIAFQEKHLKERLQQMGSMYWRDYRLVVTLTDRIMNALYDTLPPKTMLHMNRLSENGEIVIRPKPVIKDGVQIVSQNDIMFLVNDVIKNNCALCLERGKAVKKCKIRRRISCMSPVCEIPTDGSCQYQNVAHGHEYGDYFGDADGD